MTIEYIKCLTDWKKTLNSRSVYAVFSNANVLRIVGIGKKFVKVMHNNGLIESVRPQAIVEIRGL